MRKRKQSKNTASESKSVEIMGMKISQNQGDKTERNELYEQPVQREIQ